MPKKQQIDFRKILESIAHTRGSIVSIFSDFCRIAACTLSCQTREVEYLEAIQGYSKDELNDIAKALAGLIEEMENNPFEDVLGAFFQEIGSKSTTQARGDFFTPPCVSELMARLSLNPEKILAEGKPVTVNEPACGSGGMILACAKIMAPRQDLLRVTMQDLNPDACNMAYINSTLWGIPAEILQGNTLTIEFSNHCKNIHWFRVGEDQRKRVLKTQDVLNQMTEPVPINNKPVPVNNKSAEPLKATQALIQPSLDFFDNQVDR